MTNEIGYSLFRMASPLLSSVCHDAQGEVGGLRIHPGIPDRSAKPVETLCEMRRGKVTKTSVPPLLKGSLRGAAVGWVMVPEVKRSFHRRELTLRRLRLAACFPAVDFRPRTQGGTHPSAFRIFPNPRDVTCFSINQNPAPVGSLQIHGGVQGS